MPKQTQPQSASQLLALGLLVSLSSVTCTLKLILRHANRHIRALQPCSAAAISHITRSLPSHPRTKDNGQPSGIDRRGVPSGKPRYIAATAMGETSALSYLHRRDYRTPFPWPLLKHSFRAQPPLFICPTPSMITRARRLPTVWSGKWEGTYCFGTRFWSQPRVERKISCSTAHRQ